MDSEYGAAQVSILTILMGKSDNLRSCCRRPSNSEPQLKRLVQARIDFRRLTGSGRGLKESETEAEGPSPE